MNLPHPVALLHDQLQQLPWLGRATGGGLEQVSLQQEGGGQPGLLVVTWSQAEGGASDRLRKVLWTEVGLEASPFTRGYWGEWLEIIVAVIALILPAQ